MQAKTVPFAQFFPQLSDTEKSMFCKYLNTPKISRSLRKRMEKEIKRQSSWFVKLRLPSQDAKKKKNLKLLISGPIGGWEKKGKRVRRKYDPADWMPILRFEVAMSFRHPRNARILYDDDLVQWWFVRAIATREIRMCFQCWYCGKIGWGERSTARFCLEDDCKTRYHIAMRNQETLKRLPSGPRDKSYKEMRKSGAEVGLIDMPIAERSRREAIRKMRQRHRKRVSRGR